MRSRNENYREEKQEPKSLEAKSSREILQDAYDFFNNYLDPDLRAYLAVLFVRITGKTRPNYQKLLDKLGLSQDWVNPEELKQHIRLSFDPNKKNGQRKLQTFENLIKLMEAEKEKE